MLNRAKRRRSIPSFYPLDFPSCLAAIPSNCVNNMILKLSSKISISLSYGVPKISKSVRKNLNFFSIRYNLESQMTHYSCINYMNKERQSL